MCFACEGSQLWMANRISGLIEGVLKDFTIVEKASLGDELSSAELEMFAVLQKEYTKLNKSFFEDNANIFNELANPRNIEIVNGLPVYKATLLSKLHSAATKVFGKTFADNVTDEIEGVLERFYLLSKSIVARLLGIKVPKVPTRASKIFTARDGEAISQIRDQALWFTSQSYERNIQESINNEFVKAFEEGIGRDQLAIRLRKAFSKVNIDLSENQIQLLSSSTLVRARSLAEIYQMDEAGVITYTIIAILDKRTSAICEWLDGKQFTVGEAVKQADRIRSIKDPEDIRFEQPWLNIDKKRMEDGRPAIFRVDRNNNRVYIPGSTFKKNGSPKEKPGSAAKNLSLQKNHNIGFPPFHTHCRTSTIADV